METSRGSRADLHCHSTASQVARLGVQRARGLPECPTPPEEVHELARRRGMDFVTITDHDTIDARAYASAAIFVFPSRTDTFGQTVLEAQAAGLPVVAVSDGGPRSLVRDRVTGLPAPRDAQAPADPVVRLAGAPLPRDRLARARRAAAEQRTWDGALERLATVDRAVLAARAAQPEAHRAA